MIFLTVQNLGSAMADVVIDAMIAEAVRHERYLPVNFFWCSFYLLFTWKLVVYFAYYLPA